MGPNASKQNKVAPTAGGQRLDAMLGADRPAVGQGQMSSAFNSLADKVSSTADGMEAAVRLVNGINTQPGNGGKKVTTPARGAGTNNTSSRGQASPAATALGKNGSEKGGNSPAAGVKASRGREAQKRIGGALSQRDVIASRLSVRRNARKSVALILRAGSRSWRQRVDKAKTHARFALITVRRFVNASGSALEKRERIDDYFGRLCPILTELVSAEATRFASCVDEVEAFLRKADDTPAPAPVAAAAPAGAKGAKGVKPLTAKPGPMLPAATRKDLRRKVLARALTLVVQDSDRRLSATEAVPDAAGESEQPEASGRGAAPAGVAGGDSAISVERAATGQSAGASEDRKNRHGPHIGLRTRASIKELIAESIGTIEEADVEKLADTLRVMQVYVTNANSKNCPMKPWQEAPLTEMTNWSRAAGGSEFNFFIDAAREEYISGAVAIHIDCSGDGILGQMFHPSLCPYLLAKEWKTPQPLDGMSSQQIRGLPIGERQLAVLSLCAEKALGKLGRAKVRVVLTIDPREEAMVVANLQSRKFYGFTRENVLIVIAAKRVGARFNPRIRAFEEDEGSEAHLLGPGFSLKQLAFPEQAFHVAAASTPSSSSKIPLKDSALAVLSAAGVRWLSTWRCGDLGRLSPEDALDLPAMAFALKASDNGADCVTQVTQTTTFDQGVVVRPHRVAQNLTAPGMSIAIAAPRVQTPAAIQSLQWIPEADRVAPTDRWIFKLEPMCAALGVADPSPSFVWTPAITLSIKPTESTVSGDDHPVRVYPTLFVADLAMLSGMNMSSYKSPLPVVLLSGPPMGDTMLRAVALQDKSLAFQTFISKLSSQAAPLSVVASSTAKRRFDVVMLVHEGPLGGTPKTNEAAFKLLVQLLKAGEDTIHLVYFAQDAGELGRAKTVLEGFQPDDNPMLKVERKVQVITESIPIALDHFADGVGAQLVVVAASAATGGGAVLGSVAMTVAKKCTFPLLVAKPDLEGRVAAAGARLRAVQDEEVGARRDAVLRGASRDAPGLRVMLGVETGAIALECIAFMSTLLRPNCDTLLLGRCKGHTGSKFETAAGDDATLRLIGAMELLAKRRSPELKLVKRVLQGKAPLGVVEGSRKDTCDMLALQAPPGNQLDSEMLDAVGKAKGAVLIFRRNPHFKPEDV